MLFLVKMDVAIPYDLDPAERTRLLAEEKARARQLQRDGVWVHLWRVAGQYANYSVLDVASPDALHEVLWGLPLFPFMTIEVTALARHPSAI
ncbi:MAG TPA: muconolactone Delta-isomerase [Mycobacteriales bacterium]|jgi:muconolactone D-isomerase|nr:muconolactone Delta-isomerase [Mycobacteriales bacterium]